MKQQNSIFFNSNLVEQQADWAQSMKSGMTALEFLENETYWLLQELEATRKELEIYKKELRLTQENLHQSETLFKAHTQELENRINERTDELLNVTVEVEDRERNRFSLELHDDLGPLLSTIKLYFQWLAETSDPEKIKIITQKGNANIERAILTTREIAHGLGSQFLIKVGYTNAVMQFVKRINDTQKLAIDFKFNSNRRFSNFLEIIMYRITTELINNSLKYAGATHVKIGYRYCGGRKRIIFTYSDDGIGFDLKKVEKSNKGFGLMNIQQRIQLLRGEISINSCPGNGMKVNIELPVEESNPDPAKMEELQNYY